MDNAHERLSGNATAAILTREYELFSNEEFSRLSNISVAHLYRLRQSPFYLNQTSPSRKPSHPPVNMGNGAALIHKADRGSSGSTPSIKET